MAIKRTFSAKNQKACNCLACETQISPDKLQDDTVYTCAHCGQKMTVDKYDNTVVLTVIEKQYLRRRITPEIMNASSQHKDNILKLFCEKEKLKNQLAAADNKIAGLQREVKSWQQAADGLARMIEEMKEKEDSATRNDTNLNAH